MAAADRLLRARGALQPCGPVAPSGPWPGLGSAPASFPAVFLGGAGGILASRLPGFVLIPAVAVGMAAAIGAVLEFPLAAIVLATLLAAIAGSGQESLIVVGVVLPCRIALIIFKAPI